MLVSVIIPVYNVSPYIRKCLDSVASQDYKEIECLLIDDCGTDDSMYIVREWIEKYTGAIDFRIVGNDGNKGVSVSRNVGLEQSRGEYVMFVDSDDYLYGPSSVSSLVAAAVTHPDAELVVGDIESNVKSYQEMFHIAENASLTVRDDIDVLLSDRMVPWARIVKRSFLIDNNIRFRTGLSHEDNLWNFSIALAVRKVVTVADKAYYYNVRESSEMTSSAKELRRLGSLLRIAREFLLTEVAERHVVFDRVAFRYLLYILRKPSAVLRGCGVDVDAMLKELRGAFRRQRNVRYLLALSFFVRPVRKFMRCGVCFKVVRDIVTYLV